MLQEKLFYVKPKKVDVAQKSVSCRRKQDDAAQKNYFVLKKVSFFPELRTIETCFHVLLCTYKGKLLTFIVKKMLVESEIQKSLSYKKSIFQ